MDQKLIDHAQRQCWEAWQDLHRPGSGSLNRYCKVLCDVPPPENLSNAGTIVAHVENKLNDAPIESITSQKQIENLPKSGGGFGWSPLFALVVLFLLLYVAQQLEINQPGSGRAMLGWFFGVAALAVLIYINWGGSAKETGYNFFKMLKAIAILAVVVLVLGGLGLCSKDSRDADTSNVPDSWNRR